MNGTRPEGSLTDSQRNNVGVSQPFISPVTGGFEANQGTRPQQNTPAQHNPRLGAENSSSIQNWPSSSVYVRCEYCYQIGYSKVCSSLTTPLLLISILCCFILYPITLLILFLKRKEKVHKCGQCLTLLGTVKTA